LLEAPRTISSNLLVPMRIRDVWTAFSSCRS